MQFANTEKTYSKLMILQREMLAEHHLGCADGSSVKCREIRNELSAIHKFVKNKVHEQEELIHKMNNERYAWTSVKMFTQEKTELDQANNERLNWMACLEDCPAELI